MNKSIRSEFIDKVKAFYKRDKDKIKPISEEVYNIINDYPDYLDIPQTENDKRVAGNYEIFINNIPLYAGESGNVYFRACEHIYNMYNDIDKFGFLLPDERIEISFNITLGVTNENQRKRNENNAIKEHKHLLQYTDINSTEYGKDKAKYIRIKVPREQIPDDWCVKPKIRKLRVDEILGKKS